MLGFDLVAKSVTKSITIITSIALIADRLWIGVMLNEKRNDKH